MVCALEHEAYANGLTFARPDLVVVLAILAPPRPKPPLLDQER
jgi:hypothetical protein